MKNNYLNFKSQGFSHKFIRGQKLLNFIFNVLDLKINVSQSSRPQRQTHLLTEIRGPGAKAKGKRLQGSPGLTLEPGVDLQQIE